jgi:hypothetical protein
VASARGTVYSVLLFGESVVRNLAGHRSDATLATPEGSTAADVTWMGGLTLGWEDQTHPLHTLQQPLDTPQTTAACLLLPPLNQGLHVSAYSAFVCAPDGCYLQRLEDILRETEDDVGRPHRSQLTRPSTLRSCSAAQHSTSHRHFMV